MGTHDTGWSRVWYGVDRQGSRLIAMRAERHGRRVLCTALDEAGMARLREPNAPVAAALSVRESFLRWIDAPLASVSKARRVLPTVLDIQLPFPLEACVYDFPAVEKQPDSHCAGLAVAARRTAIEARLAALAEDGIDPPVLDQEGLALWDYARMLYPPADGAAPRAVFFAAPEGDTLVLGHGRRLASAHPARPGNGDQLRRLLAAVRDPDAETGQPDAQITWILCGPLAGSDAVAARVRSADSGAKLVVADSPEQFLAAALATRGVTGGSPPCNFRVGELAHARMQRHARRRELRAATAILATGIILCLANLGARWTASRRVAQAEDTVVSLVNTLAGYPVTARGRDAIRTVRDEADLRRRALAPFREAQASTVETLLRALVSRAAADGFELALLSLSAEQVEIQGTAVSWNACQSLMAMLENGGYSVTVKRGDALANERIPFTITGGRDGA